MMGQKTILIVDDEPFIRRSLSFVLRQENCGIFTANDGQEAWEKLQQGLNPDVIFLDVMMPRLSGFKLCERIKTDIRFQNIYVIMLTARWQAADRDYAGKIGADEFITKPFSPSYIVRRVCEILKDKKGAPR